MKSELSFFVRENCRRPCTEHAELSIISREDFAIDRQLLPILTAFIVISSLFNIPVDLFVYMMVFFVLCFLVYAFLYAAIGSTVSKLEDANISVLTITFLFIILWYNADTLTEFKAICAVRKDVVRHKECCPESSFLCG